MTEKSKAPDWLLKREGITNRQWKARKRAELKAVIAAYNVYRMGCAYCPGEDIAVGDLKSALERLKAALSVKSWGR